MMARSAIGGVEIFNICFPRRLAALRPSPDLARPLHRRFRIVAEAAAE
jgi:hypothetical protein